MIFKYIILNAFFFMPKNTIIYFSSINIILHIISIFEYYLLVIMLCNGEFKQFDEIK